MIKILCKRTITADKLPVPYPQIEDYNILEINRKYGSEAAEQALQQFCLDNEKAIRQNRTHLENAQKWINQCAMWHGFTHAFNGGDVMLNIQHQDWCPTPYWHQSYNTNIPSSSAI